MPTQLTNRESVAVVIAEMTLDEKLTLLVGHTAFRSSGIERFGIPSVYYLDGGAGANLFQMTIDAVNVVTGKGLTDPTNTDAQTLMSFLPDPSRRESATGHAKVLLDSLDAKMADYLPDGTFPGCFPAGVVLGSTWDAPTVYECATALGKEAQFFKIDVLLGTPNINLQRDPRAGRLFETYSEDPVLISRLAPHFARGIQDQGVVANVKHFAANNQETERHTVDEHISERTLREVYLPGFQACVVDGGCKIVMSAYNWINGVACAHNHWLLTEILRDEWSFDGYVLSDWNGAYDKVLALQAGNDMEMPGPGDIAVVRDAISAGAMDESVIDLSVSRVLNVILETPAMKGRPAVPIDREGSRQAAYNAVKEGMVLLKNDGALPLRAEANVAFFGPKSKAFITSGGGSANVITDQDSNMFDCTVERIGADRVRFDEVGADTDAVVIAVGTLGREGFDRNDLHIDTDEHATLMSGIATAKAADKTIIVVLNVCGPVYVEDFIDDVDAIVCVFIPGMEGGRACVDLLFGDICPSGKLPLTFPKTHRDAPAYGNFPGRGNEVWYAEGLFVGYRHYDFRNVEPRFPFGFGLSYTSFELSEATLSSPTMDLDQDATLTASVRVRNTGTTAGKEVIQLYLGQDMPPIVRPVKELKHFRKVELAPGEEKLVEFTITSRDMRCFDDVPKAWVTPTGRYHAYIGTSSADIVADLPYDAVGHNPCGIQPDTHMDSVVTIPGGLDTILSFVPDGLVNRAQIDMSILFAAAAPLQTFWDMNIAPQLTVSEDEKERIYADMLMAVNKQSPTI